MKRITICFLIAVITTVSARSQIAKWLVPPLYDKIVMDEIIVADSASMKVLWSTTGRRIACTADEIFSFRENMAVATEKGSGILTGFYNKMGVFKSLSDCSAAHAYPYFSDGFLLVKQGDFYRFVNTVGTIGDGQYEKAFPFRNGYATCSTFRNLQKRKDSYNLLLTKQLEPVAFFFEGKRIDDDDIEFISSVNDEHLGIVVAKHRLYYFNGTSRTLAPLYAKKGDTDKHNQAKIEGDINVWLQKDGDSGYVLLAKGGKNDQVQIRFDNFFTPLSVFSSGEKRPFANNSSKEEVADSPLKYTQEGNLYGIQWEEQEILPPQLDKLVTCFADKAIVKLSGKYGLLQISRDEKFGITINKGNPIDFRHQKYETTIRIDLPKAISASDTKIDIDPKLGCEVDKPSRQWKDTEEGNFVQYNCVLNIPPSLPDEMYGDSRNQITYPVQIVYNGLKSPVIPCNVMAWHYKYFNVDVNEEKSIHQGELTFTFNINAERTPGEAVYPTSVNIQTDSLQCELEKISESRYKCRVWTLKDGTNNIVVQILEQGCPPASFPFEVNYTKPSARTRHKAAVKESVNINKKSKKMQITPHLEL